MHANSSARLLVTGKDGNDILGRIRQAATTNSTEFTCNSIPYHMQVVNSFDDKIFAGNLVHFYYKKEVATDDKDANSAADNSSLES